MAILEMRMETSHFSKWGVEPLEKAAKTIVVRETIR